MLDKQPQSPCPNGLDDETVGFLSNRVSRDLARELSSHFIVFGSGIASSLILHLTRQRREGRRDKMKIGDSFPTWENFFHEFDKFKDENYHPFIKYNSRLTTKANEYLVKGNEKATLYPESFAYTFYDFRCTHRGKFKSQSKGLKLCKSFKSDCTAIIHAVVDKTKAIIVLKVVDLAHNHTIGPELYSHYPRVRLLNKEEEKDVLSLLQLKVSSKMMKDYVSSKYGKSLTLKDIFNLKQRNRIEKDYQSPSIPIELPTFDDLCEWESSGFEDGKLPVRGRKARKQFFLLEENCCFLNHGAFGGVLKPAMTAAQRWQLYSEKQPLRFYDRELFPLLVLVSRQLANFVGCSATDLVLVNNATYGTNSVLSSIISGPKDVIVTFSNTYGAVKKLVQHLCQKTGAVNREVDITLPITDKKQIMKALESELEKGDITLVVADHIPSNTPFIMPVKEMVMACRARNVKIFIDGAHVLGSLPLTLSDLDPDFYVSNAHKWLCCPKGAAFLYVKTKHQALIRPAVVSHGLGSGFNSEFVWAGLHDYSPMLALLTVISFWKSLGVTRIQEYLHQTVCQGAKILIQAWGSSLAAPEDMFASMALVSLPASFQHSMTSSTLDYSNAEEIQNKLYHQFNIEVPIKCIEGLLYVRISAHIYNETSDYEKLAKAVLMIAQKKGNKLL